MPEAKDEYERPEPEHRAPAGAPSSDDKATATARACQVGEAVAALHAAHARFVEVAAPRSTRCWMSPRPTSGMPQASILRATDLRVCEVSLKEMCNDHLAVNGRGIVNSRSPFRSFALGILGRRLP